MPSTETVTPFSVSHSLDEMLVMLVKHHNLHEGLFELALELQFAMGAVAPMGDQPLPGVMIGFSKIGLRQTEATTGMVVDAAKVNPKKRSRLKALAN